MSSPPLRCDACGLPAPRSPCAYCAAAGDFVHSSASVRLEALESAGPERRPQVLLAALRAGRLWSDRHDPLLTWLMNHGGTNTFARWLAEDARYGVYAVQPLAVQETERAVQRAPLWMAHGRTGPHAVGKRIFAVLGTRPAAFYALSVRLGSCVHPERGGRDEEVWRLSFPRLAGWLGLYAMRAGKKNPPQKGWRPGPDDLERATRWRRWPLENLEGGNAVICTVCGEPLPATGPCRFCATDPTREPPTELPLTDLLSARTLCQRCGIDLTTHAMPTRCPGCGASL